MRYGFGVDIGGTTVKLAYFDETGALLDKWEIPTVTENGGKQILPDVAASIAGYMAEKGVVRQNVIGIGVGVPGPVDGAGVVNRCVNLGWGVFNIAEALSDLTGFPVKAGNDANVAALGEYWMGGGAGCRSMVMVTLGTGVGGGIVLDGKLLHGAHGSGGEIGHLVLRRNETEVCGCGKYGCAEQYLSATGIVRLADGKFPTAKDIFDAGRVGDPFAASVLETYFSYMGQLLSILCCTCDPEVIVFGGGVSRAGDILLQGAEKAFREQAFGPCGNTRLAIAKLGNDAGIYGAFHFAQQTFA
jgi:glucokinase